MIYNIVGVHTYAASALFHQEHTRVLIDKDSVKACPISTCDYKTGGKRYMTILIVELRIQTQVGGAQVIGARPA